MSGGGKGRWREEEKETTEKRVEEKGEDARKG